MSHTYFPAIIERSPEGFGVFFPDLPGCVSAGDTLQEAATNAEEALALHILGLAEDNEAIPEPSQLDAIESDPDVDVAACILVRCELPGRKVRVNVMIDESLLSAIDKVASNRSQFLTDAARLAVAARNVA